MARYGVKAIGVIRTPFAAPAGTPVQGKFEPESRGEVEVFPEYAAGLKDVDGFSHLILLYRFHAAGRQALRVKPLLAETERGVFATRHPRRPNHIGLTIVRLLERRGNVLRVAGVDMLDGTPLLDVKPFVPAFDLPGPDVRAGWLAGITPDAGPSEPGP